jgi:hypothetical protein
MRSATVKRNTTSETPPSLYLEKVAMSASMRTVPGDVRRD